ncbi:uncharacterized protein PHACADRAFT_213468 [Phanerochaete carnosa HHB-10118-sp]|uniref:Fungal lipase-type domain-containing protein n=1 Tax=Phanerochaete carnosa (strain HHB-10118-sp) TaxID=650164 RepID=K5VVF4_PHACS|nr:uncharacterized protein PHACADRAFT_213468 [Phanerochaete carnosa HHB-10118-sp]EKM50554.1 hypothetical protein PHACADRAFT_213468 [Phanerochaete carnosa HHB-10118-sp]
MLARSVSCLVLVAFAAVAQAAPRDFAAQQPIRTPIRALNDSQISAFRPYAFYASAGYCSPPTTLQWDCGTNCEATPSFIPVASGGDSDNVQFWYVGYDPSLKTVIISHQGTKFDEIEPVLTDVDIVMTTLRPSLFPGISPLVEVHSGFADAQSKAARQVLAAVQTSLSLYGAKQVTMVGAAIALLDSVFLPKHISGVSFKTVVYGLPRVGNQHFADYVDAHVTLTHINNEQDPVPILPGMYLGFVHPSGEVHIQDSGMWLQCPGQDNPSTECIVGDVPEFGDGNVTDHDGPYDGVEMGC